MELILTSSHESPALQIGLCLCRCMGFLEKENFDVSKARTNSQIASMFSGEMFSEKRWIVLVHCGWFYTRRLLVKHLPTSCDTGHLLCYS